MPAQHRSGTLEAVYAFGRDQHVSPLSAVTSEQLWESLPEPVLDNAVFNERLPGRGHTHSVAQLIRHAAAVPGTNLITAHSVNGSRRGVINLGYVSSPGPRLTLYDEAWWKG